jgi:hypothetical protein
MSTSYLSRHHALGRILGKAVSHGNLGNNLEFCFTDLGSQDKWAAEDIIDKHHTLSEVPADLLDKETLVECGSRPDMLLWQRKQKPLKQEFGDPDIIYIVELKVCCDSSPEQTYQRALNQHDNLQRAICRKHPDAIVYIVVILIGVAGTAYEDFGSASPTRHQGESS